MESDSSWSDEDFVLELDMSVEYDGAIDENDNYKYEKAKIELPVDSTPSDLGIDKEFCEDVRIESEDKCELNSRNHDERKRQTTLTEYFSVLPAETPDVERASEKMVNVPLLLSQLLNARVVINRLPDSKIVKTETPTLSCKPSVQRYCLTCKTLIVDKENLMKPKNCTKCGTMLLYICDKCNEKHYHTYKSFKRHGRRCTGVKTGNSLADIVMFYCSECPYKTSYENCMSIHVNTTNHKVLDSSLKLGLKRKKHTKTDLAKARKRYCPSCEKIVENRSVEKDVTCDTCNTILLYQCAKCDKRGDNASIKRHMITKCYSGIYYCCECKYSASSWELMRIHLATNQSCKSSYCLPKYCKILQSLGSFSCEHCSFRTDYKWNLRRHLENYHTD